MTDSETSVPGSAVVGNPRQEWGRVEDRAKSISPLKMSLVNTASISSLHVVVSDQFWSITWTLLPLSTYSARRRIAP